MMCSILTESDMRLWSKKEFRPSQGRGERKFFGACSRRGVMGIRGNKNNYNYYPKCQCQATFSLLASGIVVFRHEHIEVCKPDPRVLSSSYHHDGLTSPGSGQEGKDDSAS